MSSGQFAEKLIGDSIMLFFFAVASVCIFSPGNAPGVTYLTLHAVIVLVTLQILYKLIALKVKPERLADFRWKSHKARAFTYCFLWAGLLAVTIAARHTIFFLFLFRSIGLQDMLLILFFLLSTFVCLLSIYLVPLWLATVKRLKLPISLLSLIAAILINFFAITAWETLWFQWTTFPPRF